MAFFYVQRFSVRVLMKLQSFILARPGVPLRFPWWEFFSVVLFLKFFLRFVDKKKKKLYPSFSGRKNTMYSVGNRRTHIWNGRRKLQGNRILLTVFREKYSSNSFLSICTINHKLGQTTNYYCPYCLLLLYNLRFLLI